jgi:hypothetical protein
MILNDDELRMYRDRFLCRLYRTAQGIVDRRFNRGAIESISSKNITHGEACLALLNISLTPFSDSSTHLEINSGPFTLIKLAFFTYYTVITKP